MAASFVYQSVLVLSWKRCLASAAPEQVVGILGSDLKGTTSVSFNGTPATNFTVMSETVVKAIVPTGATTGMIEVSTPSGTLWSNVPFRIVR